MRSLGACYTHLLISCTLVHGCQPASAGFFFARGGTFRRFRLYYADTPFPRHNGDHMAKRFTQDELDRMAEERDRQSDLADELAALTPETAYAEYERLAGHDE